MSLNFSSDLRHLSNVFYFHYDNQTYPEILQKSRRPYNVAIFDTSKGYNICIPFRTNITHKYAYHFKNSKRSKKINLASIIKKWLLSMIQNILI